jgi:hypothetical protein
MKDLTIINATIRDLGGDFVILMPPEGFAALRDLIPKVAAARGRILFRGEEGHELDLSIARLTWGRKIGFTYAQQENHRVAMQLPPDVFRDLVRRMEPLTDVGPEVLDHIHVAVDYSEPPGALSSVVFERIDPE